MPQFFHPDLLITALFFLSISVSVKNTQGNTNCLYRLRLKTILYAGPLPITLDLFGTFSGQFVFTYSFYVNKKAFQ